MSLVITERQSQDVKDAISTLIKEHGLKQIEEESTDDSIMLSKGMSVWSFGEYIKLNVISRKGLSIIYIHSVPKGGYWRHDFGEHIRNEKRMAQELRDLLGPAETEVYY